MARRFGQYELTRLLGRGGMGEVWGAVKLSTVGGVKMPCAIKLMHAQFAETEVDRERFLNEARIAAQLDHGRIVKVIDVGEIAGTLYLVMDRVDGVDLRTFLGKFHDAGGGRLPQHVAVFIVAELLTALAYAHNRTIRGEPAAVIHHDVTPGNIMISSSGELKLTDFGIARLAATAGRVSRPMGTVRYMAPEMFMGDYGRPASDVYQLGVILHELLDGQRYMAGCDGETFRGKIMMGPPAPLERVAVSAWLDQLREGMLATQVGARPSARAALNVIVRNAPAYASAGEELRQLYEQLVGDSRSGFTEFLDAVRDEPTSSDPSGSEPGAASTAPLPATTPLPLESRPLPAAEPTELLSTPTGVVAHPDPSAPTSSAARPSGVLVGVLATLVGVLSIVVVIVSWKLSQVVEPESAPALPAPSSKPLEPELAAPEPELVVAPKPELVVVPEPEPIVAPEPEPIVAPVAEPIVVPELAEPSPVPRKPKPVVAKMAVVLSIEKLKEGEIKVRTTSHPYKYSATLWLTPGRYPIAWRALGQSDWVSAGNLVIEDIGTDTYSVVLRDGSLDRKRNVRGK